MPGLLRTASNQQIEKEESKMLAEAEKANNKPYVSDLVSHIHRKWEEAKIAKVEIEKRLLACYRQRKSEYDPADLEIIQAQGGAEIFMSITGVKCRAIEASIKDILLPSTEKIWAIKPTPVSDMEVDGYELASQIVEKEFTEALDDSNAVESIDKLMIEQRMDIVFEGVQKQQKTEAEKKAESQENYIYDIMVEGKFENALRFFIKDIATYPAAFFKGPEIRKRKDLQWVETEQGMKIPQPVEVFKREFKRVSPFDIYPSPSSKTLNDGYLFERVRLRRKDLLTCIDTAGFQTPAIMAVLSLYGEGGLQNWLWTDQEVASLHDRPQAETDSDAIIDALIFNGEIQGKKLLDWGVDKEQVPKVNAEYAVTAWIIGNWVVCLRFNAHPLWHRGYYNTSFEPSNDSIWGTAPPEIIEDCQRMCNSSARAIANNQSIASGPQVEVHTDRIDPGEDIENIYPWKIWRTKSDEAGHGRQAVSFYQPNLMANSLMLIYNQFFAQAGDQLGIPAYEHGSENIKGAGETARGLQMLMSASSKIIKDVVRNIDKCIIEPCVYETWLHLILTDEDAPECGDIKIITKASEYMIAMEQLQYLRRDWLAITNNPTDMAIIGMQGRAKVLRATAAQLKMNVDDIIPSAAEIEQMQQAQQIAAQQEQDNANANRR